jgi:hypothetical protein
MASKFSKRVALSKRQLLNCATDQPRYRRRGYRFHRHLYHLPEVLLRYEGTGL